MAHRELWPWRPAVLPDESFSSWFARLAAGNGITPAELLRVALPRIRHTPEDLDRSAGLELISALSDYTGICSETLRQATFERWAGCIFENDTGSSDLPWLPAVRTGDRHPSFGQQICPSCLADGPEPYLRSTWRPSFIIACPEHRRLLIDRCPKCAEPIHITRAGADRGVRCWSCRCDLSTAPCTDEASDTDIHNQHLLLEIANAGWAQLGDYGPVYSITYFRILMLVCRLLASGRDGMALRAWWWDKQTAKGNRLPILKMPHVAALRPTSRRELLTIASALMLDWPHRFIEACQATGVTKRHLVNPMNGPRLPFAWTHAVEWHLRAPSAVTPDPRAMQKMHGAPKRKPPKNSPEVVELTGDKIAAEKSSTGKKPTRAVARTVNYWRLDGVSAEVRAAARLAAESAGETLGVWVDRTLRQTLDRSKASASGS